MTVNRENMEKWINALETYDREPARGMLMQRKGEETRMCALGIGLETMRPGSQVYLRVDTIRAFPAWLGLGGEDTLAGDIVLSPDGSGHDYVIYANDQGLQSPWTIAQRLRETYLKDES